MKTEEILTQLLTLVTEDREYRSELLVKYADILTRSECRVEQVNKMIGDLVKLETQLSLLFSNLAKEQDHVASLIQELANKQRHIDHLEASRKEDHEHFVQLFHQLLAIAHAANASKTNENNFNLG